MVFFFFFQFCLSFPPYISLIIPKDEQNKGYRTTCAKSTYVILILFSLRQPPTFSYSKFLVPIVKASSKNISRIPLGLTVSVSQSSVHSRCFHSEFYMFSHHGLLPSTKWFHSSGIFFRVNKLSHCSIPEGKCCSLYRKKNV